MTKTLEFLEQKQQLLNYRGGMIIKFSSSDQEGTHTYHRSFNRYTLKFKEEIRKCIRCKFLARLNFLQNGN